MKSLELVSGDLGIVVGLPMRTYLVYFLI